MFIIHTNPYTLYQFLAVTTDSHALGDMWLLWNTLESTYP